MILDTSVLLYSVGRYAMQLAYGHEDCQGSTSSHRVWVDVCVDASMGVQSGHFKTFVDLHAHPPTTDIGEEAPIPTKSRNTQRAAKSDETG